MKTEKSQEPAVASTAQTSSLLDGAKKQKPKMLHTRAPWGQVDDSPGLVAHLYVVPGMSYKPKSSDKA